MDNKADILSAVAYFDLFHYPVSEKEIYFFLPHSVSPSLFERALEELVSEECLFVFEGFYSLHNNRGLVQRRRQGNLLAGEMLGTARKVAAFLIRFPYVRGVGVSGSLSKHYADEGSDIDLFIITAPNRLWIARTLLHIVKKLSFLIRREDWFCMNYFVDGEALEIPERNIYTAIEIVTLIPMQGIQAFSDFGSANAWTHGFLPNSYGRFLIAENERPSAIKKAMERWCSGTWASRLERWLMQLTARRWQKKTENGRRNNRGVVMSLEASPHSARPAPGHYQQGLLRAYEEKVKMLLAKRKQPF